MVKRTVEEKKVRGQRNCVAGTRDAQAPDPVASCLEYSQRGRDTFRAYSTVVACESISYVNQRQHPYRSSSKKRIRAGHVRVNVPDLAAREASQSRGFYPPDPQPRRDAQRPVEPSAESALHGRARRRCRALFRASLRLRRPAVPNGRKRNRLHPPGARGRYKLHHL